MKPDAALRLNGIWGLMNLAFRVDEKVKEQIIEKMGAEQLFNLLSDPDPNILMKTLGLLRNLLSSKPHIDNIMTLYGNQIMQAVVFILEGDHGVDVKEQTLCILANVADGDQAKECIMGNEDVLKKLMSYMIHANVKLQIAATFCISNLVWNEDQGKVVIQLTAFHCIVKLQTCSGLLSSYLAFPISVGKDIWVNEGLQNQMVNIIESSLQHSLSRRLDHMATEFFQNLFMKHPMMFSPISATLLSVLNDDNVKVLNKFQLNTIPKEKFSEIFPPILEKMVSDDLFKKMEFLKKSNDTDLRNLTKKVVNNCNKSRNSAQPQKNESHKRKSIDTESGIQKKKLKTSSDTAIEEQNCHEEDGENVSQNSHTKKHTSMWLSENSSGDAQDLSVHELS